METNLYTKPEYDSGARPIEEIIIHCSATPEGRDIGVEEIRNWHVRDRRWKDIGYHFVIRLDGTVERGRDLKLAGAHCTGHNARSAGVCYVGGTDRNMQPKDTRTTAQKAALRRLVRELKKQFPGAEVHGHREFAAKACPCFDVKAEKW